MVAALTAPHLIGGHRILATASLGIGIFPEDGNDAETLVRAADRAKRNGGNSFKLPTRPLAGSRNKRGRTRKA